MQVDVVSYKHPSTFSYVGRHADEFRFLLGSMDYTPEAVLDAGCGCLEPIVLAHMLPPESTLYAVDADTEIITALEKLVSGKELCLEELAGIVRNLNDDGTPMKNTDLIDQARLEKGLREIESAGLNPHDFVSNGYFRKPEGGARIIPVNQEMSSFCREHAAEFDFAYAGALLTNMAKVLDKPELIRTVKYFVDSVKKERVIATGTSPAGIYGERGEPAVLEAAGAVATDLFITNLVIKDRKHLLGGYVVRTVKTQHSISSPIKKKEIDERIERDELLSKVTVNYTEHAHASIGEFLSIRHEAFLAIAALKKEQACCVWEASMRELERFVSGERCTISLIPGLEYA